MHLYPLPRNKVDHFLHDGRLAQTSGDDREILHDEIGVVHGYVGRGLADEYQSAVLSEDRFGICEGGNGIGGDEPGVDACGAGEGGRDFLQGDFLGVVQWVEDQVWLQAFRQ